MDGPRASQARSFNDDPARVLNATDIVRVIGDVVQLRPKGREHTCLCPFHDDHNPSMYVVPSKQIFYCFVCGAGGNAFEFVKRYYNLSFREALEMLAERAGITLTPWRPASGIEIKDAPALDRAAITQANQHALSFFRGILRHAEHGVAARGALEKRCIAPEMVEAFLLGAAPEKFDGLATWVRKKGLNIEHFVGAGLLKRREDGSHYDALRHRLIFPIMDQMGRAIAFGGRILNPDDTPKYLNSPETPLFSKGSTLYGLWQARTALRESRHAIVTEGYTDVIACHQAGICNVVATLGTALTPRHAQVLRRLVDRVTLLFDGDEAGQRAADRAADVFFAEPVDVRIAVIDGGADPDDLLKQEGGVERFHAILGRAVDALEFRVARLTARLAAGGHALGSQTRTRIIEEEAGRLVELGLSTLSPMRRQAMVRHLARLAGVDERTVTAEIAQAEQRRRNATRPQAQTKGDPPSVPPLSGVLKPVEWLVGCLLADPGLPSAGAPEGEWSPTLADLGDALRESAYGSDPLARVGARVADALQQEGRVTGVSEQLLACDDSQERAVVSALAARVERETGGEPGRVHAMFIDVARRCALERTSTGTESRDAASIAHRLQALGQRHRTYGGDPLAVGRAGSG